MSAENYTVVGDAPTNTIISLQDAKDFCRIDNTADDSLIQVLIDTVIMSCEKITNRVLREATYLGQFSRLEYSNFERYPYVDIHRSPVSSVTSVQIWDGTAYTDEPNLFQNVDGYPRILFNEYGHSVPRGVAFNDDVAYPLQITFTAGYGDGQVPPQLINAMKAHILFLYENRGDVPPDGNIPIPIESNMLYRQFRVVGMF